MSLCVIMSTIIINERHRLKLHKNENKMHLSFYIIFKKSNQIVHIYPKKHTQQQ